MNRMIRSIRNLFRRTGYDITRYDPAARGRDPFQDMRFFLEGVKCPLILDVGANFGQSVDEFKTAFPDSSIHSFEPSPNTYAKLNEHCHGLSGVKTWNYGIGSRNATLPFNENTHPKMSSFLIPSKFAWWGEIEKTINVEVLTLDDFASKHNIEYIHVLKSDTQGYEYEVFKGAEGLMNENRIGLIYYEVTFSDMYQGMPAFHEVFRFLMEHNYSLVTFYQYFFQQDLLGWTDAMFINVDYNRRRIERDAVPGGL